MRRITAFVLVTALLAGCKASMPGKTETSAMTWIKHHVSVAEPKEKNPLPYNAETLADGKEAFQAYCVACHGRDGQNTGVPFASRMSPPVPLLTSPEVQRYSDGQLKSILDNGIAPSGMPGSKGILSDDELWSIVVYIRHLPPAGSLGEPEMYTH